MWCSDPLLDALKSFGYSVVRLPKADIRPLQVLARHGKDFDRLGELGSLLIQAEMTSLPQLSENTPAANISGKRTSKISFGVGLSILGNIIGAMGGSNLGLDAQYKNAKAVVFEFSDVLADSVEVLKLDQYLAGADVNPLSRHAADLLEADELYATTNTLKSKKFCVEAMQSDDVRLQVDVPLIQQVVGGKVKVSADAQTTSKLTYEGEVPLVFGFQAVQLFYDQGIYTAIKPLGPGAALRELPPPEDGTTRLVVESPFVRLRGE
jgi:hypothetical protein